MRVPGHALRYEGKAHEWNGSRYERVLHSWIGKALCECGWRSAKLPSDTQRKRAHQAHKLEVLELGDGGWTPERVEAAIKAVNPFLNLKTTWNRHGKVQVSMPFADLCSFAEWMCGSMSESDLIGSVERELSRHIQTQEASDPDDAVT